MTTASSSPNLLERATRVLFPPRCAGCGLWCDRLFCDSCRAELQSIRAPLCARCGQPFDALAQVLESSVCADCRANRYHVAPPLHAMRAPLEYSGPIREAIHALKYDGKTSRALQLGATLREYLMQSIEGRDIATQQIKFIVPVPLHGWRKWRRGYNQSTLLASQLARQLRRDDLNIECAELLNRTRYTTPQVGLSEQERAQNIKGAFALNDKLWREYSLRLQGGAVLLLDDVTTTGSTLYECARVLERAAKIPAAQIFALTLARDV